MKSTEHLGLNLYEADDYILHDSFNSDNRKLDAAITEGRSFHKLAEATAEEGCQALDLDLSGIQWEEWQYLHLDIFAKTSGEGTLDLNFNPGSPGGSYWPTGASTGSTTTVADIPGSSQGLWADRATLPVGRQSQRTLLVQQPRGLGRNGELTYAELETLRLSVSRLSSELSILPGTKVLLWGEK